MNEETFDTDLLSRVTPALDAALGAPPSAAVSAAIAAAAHSHARGVRVRRRARFALSFAVPLAACFAIVFNFVWRSVDPATARDPLYSLLAVVDLSHDDYDDYYDDDDEDFVYEEIQYAAPPRPLSPFAIFSESLVAMQDYPSYYFDM